jgi:hypothetical protein
LSGVGFALGEVDIGFDIAGKRNEFFVRSDLIAGALAFAQNTLRLILIVPELWLGDALFEALQAGAVLFRVKDNSARG